MENFIKLNKVSKAYADNKIFDELSMSFEKNKIYTIIGPSGSGKTTLMRCLANLEQFDGGEVLISGKEINYKDLKIGFVFQQFNLFNNLSVIENLCLSPIISQKRDEKEVTDLAKELLNKVGLEDKIDSYPSKLSGGQKQRVAIARTLMNKPDFIIFDEPTSALDPEATKDILKLMQEILVNQSAIIITHEMEFAKNVSDEVIFMKNGVVIERDTPELIFNNPKNEDTKKFIGLGGQNV